MRKLLTETDFRLTAFAEVTYKLPQVVTGGSVLPCRNHRLPRLFVSDTDEHPANFFGVRILTEEHGNGRKEHRKDDCSKVNQG